MQKNFILTIVLNSGLVGRFTTSSKNEYEFEMLQETLIEWFGSKEPLLVNCGEVTTLYNPTLVSQVSFKEVGFEKYETLSDEATDLYVRTRSRVFWFYK